MKEKDLPTKRRRLFIDIESSPNIGIFWEAGYKKNIDHSNIIKERAIICICYKWEDEKEVHALHWDSKQSDKKMLEAFIKVANQSDEIIAHNCVEVNTLVLTSDLKWVKAGSLKVGDKLGAFDEGLPPNSTCRDKNRNWNKVKDVRKLRLSEVEDFSIKKDKCIKITFDNGDSIITTHDHYWLSMSFKDFNQRWRKSSDLKIGNRVYKYFNPWERDESYNAGWLSGFISGEGTLGSSCNINFCQRPGVTWDKALRICKELNMPIEKERKPKGGGLGKGDTLYTGLTGGKFKTLEYIGKLEIDRFIEKINWDKLGYLKGKNVEIATIVKIEDVGEKEVAVFSTTSKTFFAGGYPMHNCDKFDLAWIRTRCLFHKVDMFPKYTTIDTLKISRSKFKFNSNKLDYIAQFLGMGKKIKTEFSLWKDILLHKDKVALAKMIKYCQNDVILLEKVFKKMSSHIDSKTHYGVIFGEDRGSCAECGSDELVKQKSRILASGQRKIIYQCKTCGKYQSKSDK